MIDIKNKVNSFFIFNSTLGPTEGDELKKILFFHPNQVTSDAQKMQVGLCEAVVKFMTTFSNEPCEALQTQSKRYIFYQPEKDFWMVLVIRIPYATKTATTSTEKKEIRRITLGLETEFPTITLCTVFWYQKYSSPVEITRAQSELDCWSNKFNSSAELEIEPSVMHDFLVSAYKMFRMFIGLMKDIPPEDIYSKCEQFFTPYIMSRNIANDLTNVIQGINYLPLEKNSFFKVVCFIDLLEINYPDFKCVSFVYNDQLIWNGLATNDMLTLYQYLVQTLLPKLVEKEIQGGAVTAAQKHGRFVSPPDGIRNTDDLQKLHKVYLMQEDDSETRQYYLVIYRTLSATVCFTVDVNTTLSLDKFRALDAFIGPQLSVIASSISEQCALHALQSAQLANTDHSFLYFNRVNLAYKTSLPSSSLTPSTAIKPEVLSIIAGIHSDRKSLGNYGEIVIKTPDEYWITGKSSNDREFYVIIQEKNANLKDIADEVRRICEDQLKGIFFYPM